MKTFTLLPAAFFSLLATITASPTSFSVGRPCTPIPTGHAPIPNATSVEAFDDFELYSTLASSAAGPPGYLASFTDYNGSIVANDAYLGVRRLTTYDTAMCAAHCGAEPDCRAFNIYIERTPTMNPGLGCENPPASAYYRCALYGAPIFAYQAVNEGQPRLAHGATAEPFMVRIRGSNGYIVNSFGATELTATTTATAIIRYTMHHTHTHTLHHTVMVTPSTQAPTSNA